MKPALMQMGVENMTNLHRLVGLCVLWQYIELLDHALGWIETCYNRTFLHSWLSRLRQKEIDRFPAENGQTYLWCPHLCTIDRF